jgi:diguanylate cyclase (GGDEF)-like protein
MDTAVSTETVCVMLAGITLFGLLWTIKYHREIRYWKTKATTKHISGLPNHLGLEILGSKLFSQLERGIFQFIIAIFIDIDGFKEINDTQGHLAGDAMIAAFGALIASSIRRYDIVSIVTNPGGDEFVILMPNCPDEQVTQHMNTLRAAAEQDLGITFTYGYASTTEQRDCSLTSLIQLADTHMNEKKIERGRR